MSSQSEPSATESPLAVALRRLTELAQKIRSADPKPNKDASQYLLDLPAAMGILIPDPLPSDEADTDPVSDIPTTGNVDTGHLRADSDLYLKNEQSPFSDDEDDEGKTLMVDIDGVKMDAIQWIKNLKPHIKALREVEPPTTCKHLQVKPTEHQYQALAYIDHNITSHFKGILIGDPPGSGKTLVAQMAIVQALPTAKRFSIVVVPSSIVAQWVLEFDKCFGKGTIDVFVLTDPSIPFYELLKHQVIVTTYNFCMAQYRKRKIFKDTVKDFKEHGRFTPEQLPIRPCLSIFAEALKEGKAMCPYLVLDDVHVIKNSESMTYEAVRELRDLAKGCIMLTGSPIVSRWEDIFTLSTFLKSQPLQTANDVYRLFTDPEKNLNGKPKLPGKNYWARLHTFLSAWIIIRPESTIGLPALTESTVEFSLTNIEEQASNEAYNDFEKARRMKMVNVPEGRSGSRPLNKTSNEEQWAALFKAQQYAYHPKLIETMPFIQDYGAAVRSVSGANSGQLASLEDCEKWENCKSSLRENQLWKSSRILEIISVFNKQRDLDPDAKVVIFCESVFFLDIVQIAFQEMDDPVDCLCLNDRLDQDQTHIVIQKFFSAPPPSVLLVSQGAGGSGLNLTCANVVLLCGPFSKWSQEFQAYKRAYTFGQKRGVTVIRLYANNCRIEAHQARTQNKKSVHNKFILQSIIDQQEVADALIY